MRGNHDAGQNSKEIFFVSCLDMSRDARIEYEDDSVYEGEVDADDNKNGFGELRDAFGGYVRGHWEADCVHGQAEMLDGLEGFTFTGEFRFGHFHRGEMTFQCGAKFVGEWRDSKMEGEGMFVFPDGRSSIRGVWESGFLKTGNFFGLDGQPGGAMESEGQFPGKNPLLCDAYESQYVFVAPSTISGAGEGLFAKCDLPASLIVSYYNGALTELDVINARSWEENGNVVLLDDNDKWAIDVPKPYNSMEHYRASFGHKANHHRAKQNCEYVDAYHPRFGHISSIKTTREIRTGEELFLDYEYDQQRPEWYE